MVDRYAPKRRRVARLLRRWTAGNIVLVRSTPGAVDPSTPWVPGLTTQEIYLLDARIDGVSADHVDGATIIASDLMVIASPRARVALSFDDPPDGTIVDLVPQMTDTLQIDGDLLDSYTIGNSSGVVVGDPDVPYALGELLTGHSKVIKKIESVPASGPAAMFHIFIGS